MRLNYAILVNTATREQNAIHPFIPSHIQWLLISVAIIICICRYPGIVAFLVSLVRTPEKQMPNKKKKKSNLNPPEHPVKVARPAAKARLGPSIQ